MQGTVPDGGRRVDRLMKHVQPCGCDRKDDCGRGPAAAVLPFTVGRALVLDSRQDFLHLNACFQYK